jgi:Sigma-70 factor, region 1.2
MARAATMAILTAEPGLTRYLEQIRRFPLLERQDEYMFAKRWREHGDREAAHRLVTSHLRLVAKIAMGYRGYGLPISELIFETAVHVDHVLLGHPEPPGNDLDLVRPQIALLQRRDLALGPCAD